MREEIPARNDREHNDPPAIHLSPAIGSDLETGKKNVPQQNRISIITSIGMNEKERETEKGWQEESLEINRVPVVELH